jgi:hypothetical protein
MHACARFCEKVDASTVDNIKINLIKIIKINLPDYNLIKINIRTNNTDISFNFLHYII